VEIPYCFVVGQGHHLDMNARPHRRSLVFNLAIASLLAACSSVPAAGGGGTQPPAGGNPNPAGGGSATTFHVVVSDGPKAGTYDLSTTDPGACTNVDEGYFTASFLETSDPGLDYISATLHPGNRTGLAYSFDANDEAKKVNFVGEPETVTFDLNDQGSTATVHVVSAKNYGSQEASPQSFDTGKVDMTVQCAAVMRPGT